MSMWIWFVCIEIDKYIFALEIYHPYRSKLCKIGYSTVNLCYFWSCSSLEQPSLTEEYKRLNTTEQAVIAL